jgi:glycosyltransferase involved in cell wall biosynthesis
MTEPASYPRVLLVSSAKIKAEDPAYLLVRTEFGDWPQECLAQIYASDDLPGHGEFCGRTYALGPCDRFLGGLFRRLRGSVSGLVAPDSVPGSASADPASAASPRPWVSQVKKGLGEWLIRSGLWEVLFAIRLSAPMARFIEDFQPDILYCQGYSLGFAILPLRIAHRFGLPICFQTTDDWPSYTYRHSPVGWLLRRRARQLVAASSVRMAFGEKMKQVLEQRYHRPFQVTYHADRPDRFPSKPRTNSSNPRRILFTGSLALKRYEAMEDLLAALRSLGPALGPVEVHLYTSGIPKEVPEALRSAPEVAFLPLPSHQDLPTILAEADLLFLPESFSVEPGMIELSISTKCHLYMLSRAPILVYGPTYSGTVEYAAQQGWAAVVTKRDPDQLAIALQTLLGGSDEVQELRRRAETVALHNHNLTACRAAFREILAAASRTPHRPVARPAGQ